MGNTAKDKANKSSKAKHNNKNATKIFTNKSSASKEIAKAKERFLSKSNKSYSVGALNRMLLKRYKPQDGESWDISGLTVGDSSSVVTKVAVALDPTVAAIKEAAKLGANVLVTHHPPFLQGPTSFQPANSSIECSGALVWAAISNGVALLNFHTCLDVSKPAQYALPKLLGIVPTSKLLETIDGSGSKGYGTICRVPPLGKKQQTLKTLSARCLSVFGKTPKVWGNLTQPINICATVLGSANSVADCALSKNVHCLICGEISYHKALELSHAGISVIELGHDVSELPLVAVLAKTITDIGLNPRDIIIIDQSDNWNTPEAVRL